MQYGPHSGAAYAQQVCWLPLERISPRPSMSFDRADSMTLAELTDSIRRDGLIRPITVQQTGNGRYRVISGNRRLMACRMAGFTHIDAVILAGSAEDAGQRQRMEALLSGQMHYLEEARVMRQLMEEDGMTRDDLARSLGCTASTVTQRVRLTELDEELRTFLMEEGMPERVAQALVKLPDQRARMTIARQAARQHLSVRDVELLIASAQARLPVPPSPGGRTISLVRDHRLYLNAIRAIVAQMQEARVDAQMTERTTAGAIELTLRIPTRMRRAAGRASDARGS